MVTNMSGFLPNIYTQPSESGDIQFQQTSEKKMVTNMSGFLPKIENPWKIYSRLEDPMSARKPESISH